MFNSAHCVPEKEFMNAIEFVDAHAELNANELSFTTITAVEDACELIKSEGTDDLFEKYNSVEDAFQWKWLEVELIEAIKFVDTHAYTKLTPEIKIAIIESCELIEAVGTDKERARYRSIRERVIES